MKKTASLAACIIFWAFLCTGCIKNGAETTVNQERPQNFQSKAEENTPVILFDEISLNENDISPVAYTDTLREDSASLENNENSNTQGKYLWEEEYANPLIKYVGGKENFPRPSFPVDFDFTTFSGSEFDDHFADIMFLYPKDYLGKTIRFVGQYSGVFDEIDNKIKHFVVFDDPAGCCIRFIEFEWNEGRIPAKYPENLSIIDVAGVFSSYFDKSIEWDFNYLKVDTVPILKGAES